MKIISTTAVLVCLCTAAFSQSTETVLYSFRGYPVDGAAPFGSLLFAHGKLYGATAGGGKYCFEERGCGTIYELTPTESGEWTEKVLYSFCSTGDPTTCPDGAYPYAGLIMDAKGNLYGTTAGGGSEFWGTVFQLSPPSVSGGSWTHTTLWTFTMDPDNGKEPLYGNLATDASGNLYGTAVGGGARGAGIVYELSPQSDGTYSFAILHSFSGSDGATPEYGVTFDSSGKLYGTASQGGRGKSICNYGCGLVFELSPSGGTWQETVLLEFDGIMGKYPTSPISIDANGNLYGTFAQGGGGTNCYFYTCGGVFKLIPNSNRKYVFDFSTGSNDGNPPSGITIGEGDTLYGTEGFGGAGQVYVLQGSQESILYNFCSLANCADGSSPTYGNLVIHHGLLYGSTTEGGSFGYGVVYSLAK